MEVTNLPPKDWSNKPKESAPNPSSGTPILDKIGKDLTAAALEGKIDPVIGRQQEIERATQILSRRKKNNPVLIGEPGVGKTALVEGIALRIVNRDVSRVLYNTRVVTLDMGNLVAGATFRGEFEERIKTILNEVTKAGNIILFIDELHTLIGAGNSSGGLDAANILKPALARGEIQIIGATTLNEYRENIEKDGALERRFQKITIEPTSVNDTIDILNNIKEYYEEYHGVIYTDEAIRDCVILTDRYITDRYLPDKAIDALDEAGSRIKNKTISVPNKIVELEGELENYKKNKITAVRNQDFESAARFRDIEKQYAERLKSEEEAWKESLKDKKEVVGEEVIGEVVSMMSGIPVSKISNEESNKLSTLSEKIKSELIGQDNAVERIVKSIQRSRTGLKDPKKPIGSFIFLGTTGVGKTQLAKVLANQLFNGRDNLIRIDMSEYMEKFAVSRLVGAPPGYVGYEEGGQLTEKVRRNPYSVVLLDEIEKAHPDVFNLLLQILDDGHITDSLGRQIDFKNTIIIMTSNIGTRKLKDFGTGIGFKTKQTTTKEAETAVLTKSLMQAFKPEFLNRIDDVIYFNSLDLDSIKKIIHIELKKLYSRVKALGYTIELKDKAIDFIAEKGFDSQFGARPLQRAIQKYVEEPLAETIIKGKIKEGDCIVVSFRGSGLTFSC